MAQQVYNTNNQIRFRMPIKSNKTITLDKRHVDECKFNHGSSEYVSKPIITLGCIIFLLNHNLLWE
jgi:hypothetical protein